MSPKLDRWLFDHAAEVAWSSSGTVYLSYLSRADGMRHDASGPSLEDAIAEAAKHEARRADRARTVTTGEDPRR